MMYRHVRVQRKEVCQIHFKVLQNAAECTAGIPTIGAFLGEEPFGDNPLARSIEILQHTAASARPGKTCEDAMDAMQCMIARNNRPDYAWSSLLLLPGSLFSESSFPGLLAVEYKSLKDAVEPVFEQVPTAEDI
jgi:hypothetical protein